jgi:hypothetical protein
VANVKPLTIASTGQVTQMQTGDTLVDGDGVAIETNKVKVSSNDTTPEFLIEKLTAGTGITVTETNNGGDEGVTIATTITQYTDEMAQDAVGNALVDSGSIDFTYNDAGNTITASVIPGGVDHGSLSGLGDDDHNQYLRADGTRALILPWTANNAIDGVTQLDVDNIRINGNAITSTNTNGDITITPNGTGDIVLDGLNWPQADGAAGQVLQTDGSAQLQWTTVTGTDELVKVSANDTTPGYLEDKIVSGNSAITIATLNDGANEDLEITFDETAITITESQISDLAHYTDADVEAYLTALGDVAVDPTDRVIIVDASDGTLKDVAASSIAGLSGALTLQDVTDNGNTTTNDITVDNININGNTISSTDTNGNIALTPNGTGSVVLDGNAMPQGPGTSGQVLTTDGAGQTSWAPVSATQKISRVVTIGRPNASSDIQTGRSARIPISFNGTINGWRLVEANEYAGSIVIDVLKGATYAGAVSIAGTEKPTLASSDEATDTTLSSWTTPVVAGDMLWLNIESCDGCYQVVLTLEMELA